MLLDNFLTITTGSSIVGAIGTTTLTNVIDLGLPARNIGGGEPMVAVIDIVAGVFGVGAFVDFRIVTDAQDPMATDGTATIHCATGPIPRASLATGTRIVIGLERIGFVNERYLGVLVVVSGAATTVGTIAVSLHSGVQDTWRPYADAVN